MNRKEESLGLVKGTLDLLVMKTLSWGPMHGYAIANWLEQRSGGSLMVEDSALYQALHRLEARRLVEAEWRLTKNKRRARFYRITPRGKRHFQNRANAWERYVQSVSEIMAATSLAGES